MSMSEWAERECRIACGKENPDFDFDSDDFDYGCSCYKSALKAYKSLMDDGHSGSSFGFTKNILIRLMEGQPLTPITDGDFFNEELNDMVAEESPQYLKDRGLKSSLQCPRMSSLFREETLDGKVTYHDIDRCIMVDVEQPSDTFGSGSDRILDKMFPITMPYMPSKNKYKIYTQTFLTDRKNGDFDTHALLYVITPDGDRIDLNIYETEDGNGGWKRITKEEYDALLEKRIDKLSRKVAEHLLWTLIENSSDDETTRKRRVAYAKRRDEDCTSDLLGLTVLCKFFENPDNYQYNTFDVIQKLCRGDVFDKPELNEISTYLKIVLTELGA